MHYPAGGVGLNVGVQDAMNLGWKLAAVVQGRAGSALLDTYDAERHAVGEDLTAQRHAGALGIATRRSPLLGSDRTDWNTAGAALIRPDGHVWWAGSASSSIIDSDLTSRLTHLPARF